MTAAGPGLTAEARSPAEADVAAEGGSPAEGGSAAETGAPVEAGSTADSSIATEAGSTADTGRAIAGGPTRAPRIVAMIPAHDEGPRIGRVVREALATLAVIVVDDGSSDDTAVVARAAGAEVVEQRPNRGKGAALRAGFKRALDEGVDAVVTLDGDGQHAPAEIARFVDAWLAGGPDLVVGARDFARMPLPRRIANTVGGRAFSWAVGRHVPDNQSGYRLVSRRLMEAMLSSTEQAFEFEVEMLVRCIANRWAIAWVPISTIYAGEPSHIRPLAHFTSFVRVVRQARRVVRGEPPA